MTIEKSLSSRIHDCILGLTISTGFMSMLIVLAFILHDNGEWMGCVISIVLTVIAIFSMAHFWDVYEDIIEEIREIE